MPKQHKHNPLFYKCYFDAFCYLRIKGVKKGGEKGSSMGSKRLRLLSCPSCRGQDICLVPKNPKRVVEILPAGAGGRKPIPVFLVPSVAFPDLMVRD